MIQVKDQLGRVFYLESDIMNVATHLRNHALAQCGIFEGFYKIKDHPMKRDNAVDPSERYLLEVARRTEEIREGWSERERAKRAGQPAPVSYEVPLVRGRDIGCVEEMGDNASWAQPPGRKGNATTGHKVKKRKGTVRDVPVVG